jgi:hypothetical protein
MNVTKKALEPLCLIGPTRCTLALIEPSPQPDKEAQQQADSEAEEKYEREKATAKFLPISLVRSLTGRLVTKRSDT